MQFARIGLVLVLSAVCLPTKAENQELEVVDHVVKKIYATLARDRGFNLLSAPDVGAAKIGSVYYVTEPKCARDLIAMAKDGKPAQLYLAMELPNQERFKPMPITDWTSVRLAAIAGRSLSADLGAEKTEWAAQMRASIAALNSTNAQIWFATRRYGSVPIKQAMVSELRVQGLLSPSDLGDGAVGALAPHEELVVQKFEFDRKAFRGKKGAVMLRLMELFGARIEAGTEVTQEGGFSQATYSIAAFKAVTSLFPSCSRSESISK